MKMKKSIKLLLFAITTCIVSIGGVVSHNPEGVESLHDKEIPGNNATGGNVKYEVVGFGVITKIK
jgi:hypothetical protein